jgi:hypothetical protein
LSRRSQIGAIPRRSRRDRRHFIAEKTVQPKVTLMTKQVRYLVFDIESVADPELVA